MAKFINKLKYIFSIAGQREWPRPHNLPSSIQLSTLGLLLTINFALLISSCGLDIEDSTSPSTPQWVEKSMPEEWPERGIDAHESGGIFLEWDDIHDENINSYSIHRAQYYKDNDSLGNYSVLTQLLAGNPQGDYYVDRDVDLDVQYFYKVQSEDNTGKQSKFSDSIFYTLLPTYLYDLRPSGYFDTLNQARELYWTSGFHIDVEDYTITILNENYEPVYRELFSPSSYTDREQSRQIPENISLIDKKIYKWRIDTGADYIDGIETAGSESPWSTFLYIDN